MKYSELLFGLPAHMPEKVLHVSFDHESPELHLVPTSAEGLPRFMSAFEAAMREQRIDPVRFGAFERYERGALVPFETLKEEWLIGYIVTEMINDVFACDIVYSDLTLDDFKVKVDDDYDLLDFVQMVTGCSDDAIEDVDVLMPEWVLRNL